MNKEFTNFFNKAKEYNINDIQITKTISNYNVVEYKNEKPEKISCEKNIDYLIKALYNNKKVELNTNNITNINEIIECIKNNECLLETNDKDKIINQKEKIVFDKQVNLDISKESNIISSLYNELGNKKIKMLYTFFYKYYEKIIIANTNDVYLEDTKNKKSFYVEVLVEDNNKKASFGDTIITTIDQDIDIKQITKETVDISLSKLNCQNIDSAKYNVIFSNKVLASIISPFVTMFDSEEIYEKKSLLTNKFNQKVFSSKITIKEEPQNKDLIGKRLFDDEGVITQDKLIIDKGVFVNKLYSLKSALKENKKSTGNYYGKIDVRNLYIVPGDKSRQELINDIEDGIYIDEVQGVHAGIDIISGKISLQAEGYIIKNKQLTSRIEQLVLTTDIFDLLNNVIDISNDLEFVSDRIGMPSISVKDIYISQ